MAVQPAELLNVSSSEVVKQGITIVTMTQTWQVVSNIRNESPSSVLAATNIPSLLSSYSYGGMTLYCLSRRPSRSEVSKTALKWIVQCAFTNDSGTFLHNALGVPVSNPEDAVDLVSIDYAKQEQPTTTAKWNSCTIGPYHKNLLADGTLDPSKVLTPPTWLPRTIGPVVNSAGDPRFSTSERDFRRVNVTRYVRTWDNQLEIFRGAINEEEVQILEYDGSPDILDPDDPALRARHIFPPLTLKVDDIVKENVWLAGSLYFKLTFVLIEDKRTWIHSELDAGQRQRIFEGQTKSPVDLTIDPIPTPDTYTSADVAAFSPPIETYSFGLFNIEREGVAVGDPVKLNGFGMPLPIIRDPSGTPAIEDGDSIYVNFEKHPILKFYGNESAPVEADRYPSLEL